MVIKVAIGVLVALVCAWLLLGYYEEWQFRADCHAGGGLVIQTGSRLACI